MYIVHVNDAYMSPNVILNLYLDSLVHSSGLGSARESFISLFQPSILPQHLVQVLP